MLIKLTRKKEKFIWNDHVLVLLDEQGNFVIYIDASHKGLRFVLM